MDILWRLFGQKPNLQRWEQRPVAAAVAAGPAAGDHRDAHEADVACERPGPPEVGGPHRRLAETVSAFRIFPPRLVAGVLRRTPVAVGDTVGTCFHFTWGVDLFFACRVTAVFDEAADGVWRTGFTYRTLQGHPMLGEETFSVEKDLASGRVRVAVRSWSRRATFLARALAPLVRRWQVQAGRSAPEYLAGCVQDLRGPTPEVTSAG
jgi:Domain of unknown function (DUF1990)